MHRRVVSCRGVEIFSGLLAFDNYVPSQNYSGWFASERERERGEGKERERELRSGFQLVGRLCAPRSREQCRQDYLPPPFLVSTSPLYTAARLKTTAPFFSYRFHRFPSRLPLPALCPFVFAIRVVGLACSIFLDSLSSSPLSAEYHSLLFCSQVPLLLCNCALALAFHHHAFTVIHRTCIPCSHSHSFIPRVSSSFTLHLPFLFFRFRPSPTARFMKVGDMG